MPDEPEAPEPLVKKDGNPLMLVALLAVLTGGGVVAFFKKKPDTKGSTDLDEYGYGDEDDQVDEDAKVVTILRLFHGRQDYEKLI